VPGAKLYRPRRRGHNDGHMRVALRVLAILGLVLANAFFVAAEYALLTVRRTRLEQLAAGGNSSARLVQSLLADVGRLFSGTQLGITAASLLLGWLGEGFLADALQSAFENYLHPYVSFAAAHTIALVLAFALVTTLLMVLGELVPKTLAYERAELVALLVARPMTLYFKLAAYPVRVLHTLAEMILTAAGSATGGSGPPHTPEEVKLIVSAIRQRGLLAIEQEEMIHGVFDLQRVRVREVMVPWPQVERWPATRDLRQLLARAAQNPHSRIPIYEGSPDRVIGILSTRDLLRVAFQRFERHIPLDTPFDLRAILREPLVVPETTTLSQMLAQARRKRAPVALVVDEFGTYVGLVTVDDILAEIVGDIESEERPAEPPVRRVSDNLLLIDGATTLRELADEFGLVLPRDAGYETLGGFVLARLGIIPRGGESFVFEGYRFTVREMDQRRVATVAVEKLPAPPGEAVSPPARAQA
jgi:putative hemolysin